MNTVLLLISTFLTFGALVLVNKFFKASGVIGFMGVATVLANILTCKSVDLFGLSATMGTVMFASNFLATDILTECYGVKEARKGVMFALCASVGFLVAMQAALLFAPNDLDMAHESMATLFTIAPRITLGSLLMFAVSNFVDIKLYDFLRVKMQGRHMWLRNNVSTIISNGAENFLFYTVAFVGVFAMSDILVIALSATIIEAVIAVCDTPFLYLATRGDRHEKHHDPAGAGKQGSRKSSGAWSQL